MEAKTFDLKAEVKGAELDPENLSLMTTPSGFILATTEGDIDTMVLNIPSGGELTFSTAYNFTNPDPLKGGTWNVYLPKKIQIKTVVSKEASYSIEQFVKDLFEKFNELTNAETPEWEPQEIIFLEAIA